MLELVSSIGNIFTQNGAEGLSGKPFEKLEISRNDLEKNRIRRRTDKGTDVSIILERGSKLNHGDIFRHENTFIVIYQSPEKVITVKINEDSFEIWVLLGHIIGNRHRPISIQNKTMTFPIQADSELEVFEKLLHPIIEKIELQVEEKIYIPDQRMNVHEH
ncbi:MAG: Urease accessory protein [Nitrosarchaeum sp.]|nr:Urease accessory protein [Nitrosarchaeum sp.]